ncbi:MAG: type II 3-dehydroquinate dehydratase [Desulfovibrio sp.]|nr:type II 3-dehydroquinate dehydratase [Desulfovibrio sp.]
MTILVLHGVNLNMFGKRDPVHYGTATLEDINATLHDLAKSLDITLLTFQTNHEGEMIERIHHILQESVDAVVINAGAWTHTSLALADALAILPIPCVEVHMSNIHARESIRHTSLLAPVVSGSIVGFGVESYCLGLRAACALVKKTIKPVATHP